MIMIDYEISCSIHHNMIWGFMQPSQTGNRLKPAGFFAGSRKHLLNQGLLAGGLAAFYSQPHLR